MREYQGVGECQSRQIILGWAIGLAPRPWHPQGVPGPVALLYFHHHGQDHWTTVRLFVKELAKRMFDLVFDK